MNPTPVCYVRGMCADPTKLSLCRRGSASKSREGVLTTRCFRRASVVDPHISRSLSPSSLSLRWLNTIPAELRELSLNYRAHFPKSRTLSIGSPMKITRFLSFRSDMMSCGTGSDLMPYNPWNVDVGLVYYMCTSDGRGNIALLGRRW